MKSNVHSNYMYSKVTPADNKALEISCNEKWTEKHLGFSPCCRLNFVLEPDSSWPDWTVFGSFVESVTLGLRTGPQRVNRKQCHQDQRAIYLKEMLQQTSLRNGICCVWNDVFQSSATGKRQLRPNAGWPGKHWSCPVEVNRRLEKYKVPGCCQDAS